MPAPPSVVPVGRPLRGRDVAEQHPIARRIASASSSSSRTASGSSGRRRRASGRAAVGGFHVSASGMGGVAQPLQESPGPARLAPAGRPVRRRIARAPCRCRSCTSRHRGRPATSALPSRGRPVEARRASSNTSSHVAGIRVVAEALVDRRDLRGGIDGEGPLMTRVVVARVARPDTRPTPFEEDVRAQPACRADGRPCSPRRRRRTGDR